MRCHQLLLAFGPGGAKVKCLRLDVA